MKQTFVLTVVEENDQVDISISRADREPMTDNDFDLMSAVFSAASAEDVEVSASNR
jgi:hypothetical protein